MLYRKSPPAPPRLLLRIAAAAGAGTLYGIAACSSPPGLTGVAPAIPSDASDDAPLACGGEFCGIVYDGSVGDDALPACGGGFCGILYEGGVDGMAHPHDGSSDLPDAGDQGGGDAAPVLGVVDGSPVDASAADAADDATAPCHPCGVVIRPDR
jgi:hypothetical protein